MDTKVAMRLRKFWIAILVIVLIVVTLAWIDAGRQEQRMVVEPVALPKGFS